MRQRLLDAPFQVCPERAVLWTESMGQSEGKPQVIRNALAFQHLLENMTVAIRPDELIVGTRTSKLRGAPLFPEVKTFAIETQIDTYDRRPIQPFQVDPGDKRAIKRACRYWRGRTLWERAFGLMPRDLQREVFSVTYTVENEMANGIGHFIAGNRKLLAKGLSGIRDDARAALERGGFDEERSRHFLEAVIISADAARGLARRYAAQARDLAQGESDPLRRRELTHIGEVCDHCLEGPPRTFREALQAVWFNQMLCQLECGGFAISPGRLDQLLGPFYSADLEAGRLSAEEARELIECLYLKMSEVVNVLDTVILPVTSGPPIAQSLTIGGVDRDGNDATTELTHCFLEAFDQIRTVSPNLAVRFHPGTPPDFTRRAMDAVRRGAALALFNDQIVIKAMERKGVSPEESRDYAIVGCVEPTTQGDAFGSTDSNLVNLARCLELALHNGDGVDGLADRERLARQTGRYYMANHGARRPLQLMLGSYFLAMKRRLKLTTPDLYLILRGKSVGPATGDPRSFASFDDLARAFHLQVAHAVNRMTQAMHFVGQAHAELKPTPFISGTIDDCVERGLDVTWGGARYNYTGPQAVGLADTADGLAAVKKLVFEEGRVKMDDLVAALAGNFEGAEPLRQMLGNHAPKYGNGDPEADEMARLAASIYCGEVSRHRNYRGGTFQPGIYSLSSNLFFGIFTGALPDGRKRGEPLATGVSPVNGREREGPAAVLRSAARIDGTAVTNGWVLNLSFDPESVRTEANLEKFAALNLAYFKQGGFQVQHNCLSTTELEDARCHPERHRGLLVRVAGYSALFTELDAVTQEDIIRRVAHRV